MLTFLHHLLQIIPISPKSNGLRSVSPAPTSAMHQQTFPLGQLFEDLTTTLSLRPVPNQNPSALSIWIVTVQFMLSCLRSSSQQALYNAGITTPVILGIIKHILLELTRLPSENMDPLQRQCFKVGKEMLDIFLIRDPGQSGAAEQPVALKHQPLLTASQSATPSVGTVTFYDVIKSVSSVARLNSLVFFILRVFLQFPELYIHFLHATQTLAAPQPEISNPNVWLMTLHYMITSIMQDHRILEQIKTEMAVNIIKHLLREINKLPASLTTDQTKCLNKGKELINLLLLGPAGDGAGVVSHYDIIVAVS